MVFFCKCISALRVRRWKSEWVFVWAKEDALFKRTMSFLLVCLGARIFSENYTDRVRTTTRRQRDTWMKTIKCCRHSLSSISLSLVWGLDLCVRLLLAHLLVISTVRGDTIWTTIVFCQRFCDAVVDAVCESSYQRWMQRHVNAILLNNNILGFWLLNLER